jgi:hypothetical protein
VKPIHLFVLAISAVALPACSNPEAQITNRIQIALDDCKAADGETYNVSFDDGDPYPIYSVLCELPVTDVGIVELDGVGSVGPYRFYFRQNVKEDRWTLARVKWPDLEEASNYFKQAEKGDAEFTRIDELMAKAMVEAPQIADVPYKRMKYLMEWRKQKKGKADTNPTSLGVAEAFYKEGLALAQKNGDKDLEARMRLMVINYWDHKRTVAEDAAAPNSQWREWEQAAVKAIRKEAKDAKKAGNAKLAKEKRKEADYRWKSIPDEEAKQQVLKDMWAERAKTFKAVECTEIKAGSTLLPKDPALKKKWLGVSTLTDCP